jgi:signal transduction histidine kinase
MEPQDERKPFDLTPQEAELHAALASAREAQRLAENLVSVGRALTGTLDLAQVLDLVLEHLSQMVEYDRIAVMLAVGDEMEMVAARGFPANMQPSRIRISLLGDENDIYRQIYLSQRPLSIPDVSKRPDWQYVEGLPPARSWLGVPLIRSNVVIGQLSITRETLHPFTDSEVTLASTFAGQAAIALENARLYDRITRAYEQLERLDRTKSDFIEVASHELRTPLTILQTASQILVNDPAIKSNPYHLEMVTSVQSGTHRLHEIVESMLDMAKIDSRTLQLHPRPLPVPMLLQTVCNSFRKVLAERRLELKLEDMRGLPEVTADLEGLRKVFYHLIGNAIKYTPDGGQITISGRPLTDDKAAPPEGGIEIIVSDTGIGIDPQMHEAIFEKFYQTGQVALHSTGKTKFKGGGPGLGLTIARGIVQAHGGRLWVESQGYDETTCPGSQFHVVLPLTPLVHPQK